MFDGIVEELFIIYDKGQQFGQQIFFGSEHRDVAGANAIEAGYGSFFEVGPSSAKQYIAFFKLL